MWLQLDFAGMSKLFLTQILIVQGMFEKWNAIKQVPFFLTLIFKADLQFTPVNQLMLTHSSGAYALGFAVELRLFGQGAWKANHKY